MFVLIQTYYPFWRESLHGEETLPESGNEKIYDLEIHEMSPEWAKGALRYGQMIDRKWMTGQ